ncbi:MAG TPA: cytochrome d ubiquinol oxidase subunit II, partial [Methylophilus sp.]
FKTSGGLQATCYRLAKPIAGCLFAIIIVISIWTPLMDSRIAARWFGLPNLWWLSPIPILTALCFYKLQQALKNKAETSPFIYTLGLVLLGYAGLGISIWPNIIPPDISIQAAASPPESQLFALIGALIILPIILIYTAWGYYIFRGKVQKGEAYH